MLDKEVTYLRQRHGVIEAVRAIADPALPRILAPLHDVQERRIWVGSDEARLAHAGVVLRTKHDE